MSVAKRSQVDRLVLFVVEMVIGTGGVFTTLAACVLCGNSGAWAMCFWSLISGCACTTAWFAMFAIKNVGVPDTQTVSQAIPPAYTEYLGRALHAHLSKQNAGLTGGGTPSREASGCLERI